VEKPKSIIAATALGALDETRLFFEGVFRQNAGAPRNFISSVHNSMAGKLAMDLGITGPNLTICDGHNSFASAIAAADLLNNQDMPVLILVVDETIPLLAELAPHFSDGCRPYLSRLSDEGAVVFLCCPKRDPPLPSIGCPGVVPVDGEPRLISCAREYTDTGYQLIDAEKSSGSFAGPAFAVENLLKSAQKNSRYIIGSYSPAGRAAALIELCL